MHMLPMPQSEILSDASVTILNELPERRIYSVRDQRLVYGYELVHRLML